MSSHHEIADCLLVDWGTSTLRAWVLDSSGEVLVRRTSSDGMGKLKTGDFEGALLALTGDKLRADATTQIIVCGMAGARNGWKEAAYREVPCEPVATGGLTPVETADGRIAVAIVPGLCQLEPADVMRGEETQLAGLIAERGLTDAVVCLPGTHAKWARLEGGRVRCFSTFMTGEMFAVMADHSILRHSLAGDGCDDEAFMSAVATSLETPQQLTGALFSIRATSLLEGLGREAARSRLSGLLIGVELAATRNYWEGRTVHLVGTDALAGRYAAAIEFAGGLVERHDAEALTLAGLSRVRDLLREEAG